jgi:serine/threonine-protein kinase
MMAGEVSAGGAVGGEFRDEADGVLSGFRAGTRVAGYRLEEQVGAGGMAVVFRAWDERLDRRVALKVLAPALAADEAFRRRFIREAKAAAAVDDPHIIPVFETGEVAGTLFIAMRYVPGGNARSLVRRAGPIPAGRVAAIICSVASALDAAHGAGLVHRDVKPANILVDVRPGRPDHVYLSDFGISKGALSSSGPTGPGQFLGTVNYAAPEQIEGQQVDGRADQYSLACAAFELLSGAPPFPRDDVEAVIWAHLSEPPPLLTSRRPGLSGAVDPILAKALAKAPEGRYASCQEFAHALRVTLNVASDEIEAVISPRAGDRRATIVWPASSGADRNEGGPVAAASGLRRSRRTRRAPKAAGGQETIPSRPAVLKARHARTTLPPHNAGSRLMTVAAMLIATVSVGLAVRIPVARAMAHHAPSPHAFFPPRTMLPPSPISWLGVDVAGQPSYRPVATFTRAAGTSPDLAGYPAVWGKPFGASFARTLVRHGMTPLVQIDPVGISLPAIANGDDDAYLRAYAVSVRNFGHPIVISFGQDMNAPGHPWGYGHAPARTLAAAWRHFVFVAAWRHIVTLFRDQGTHNVIWMWAISADRPGISPAASWWPGAAYVTWITIDGRYIRPSDTFASVFGRTLDQMQSLALKPMLVSVTSVAPAADQFDTITDIFSGVRRYPVRGLIWGGQDQNSGNHQNSATIDASSAATYAFRLGVSSMFILPL